MVDNDKGQETNGESQHDADAASAQPESQQEARFEWAEQRTDMANERTDWALERTVLASERTFSAWLRTGMTAMEAGLGIARLLSSVTLPWLARAIGVLLIIAGATAFVVGVWRHQRITGKLEQEGMRGDPSGLSESWLLFS
jgi:putative membrane protein